MQVLHSRYFVDFEYLGDGIRLGGGCFPVLKMDWADGDTLDVWLGRHGTDRRALAKLRDSFAALAAFLEQPGIAPDHIHSGTILVSRSGLRLVGYDGVYGPGMPPC